MGRRARAQHFDAWAQRWEGNDANPEGNNPETVVQDWARMHAPFRVGWSWLQEQAENLSEGEYVSAVDEFQADPSAPTERPDMPVEQPKDAPAKSSSGVIEFTDQWVTDFVLKEAGCCIRYVPRNKDWHVWNGHAWAVDTTNKIYSVVKDALLKLSTILQQRATNLSTAEAKPFYLAAKALLSKQRREAIDAPGRELSARCPRVHHRAIAGERSGWVGLSADVPGPGTLRSTHYHPGHAGP